MRKKNIIQCSHYADFFMVPQGYLDLVHSNAVVVEEFLDVEFEVGSGIYARVETELEQVTRA